MNDRQVVSGLITETEATSWLEQLFGSDQTNPRELPTRQRFTFEANAWVPNTQAFEQGDRVVFSDTVPTDVVDKLGVTPDSPVVVFRILNEEDTDTVVCFDEGVCPMLGIKTHTVTFPEPVLVGIHFATQQILQIPVSCARNLDR